MNQIETESTESIDCLTMSTQSQPPGLTPKYIFSAEIENIQLLIPIFRSICIKRMVIMAITDHGLKISCEEENRSVQAILFLAKNLFFKYQMINPSSPETLCFKMSDFLTAISILFPKTQQKTQTSGNHNLLKIKYENMERIKLQVINDNHSVVAYIQTYNHSKLIVYSMSFVNKIIMDASVLVDFWRCADTTSTKLYLKIYESDPWFEMITDSDRGRFSQRISAHSAHIEHFECTIPMEQCYEMTSMHFTVRPLLLSSKVSLKIDSKGLLNMQFMIHLSNLDQMNESLNNSKKNLKIPLNTATTVLSLDSQKCFVEFFIIPSID